MPSGRDSPTVTIFSETICLARKMSIPQSNSTQTKEYPYIEDERTRRTLVAPLTAVSTGKVTSRSTSSADIPCASDIITTVGAVRSGNTSMSVRLALQSPPAITSAAPSSTSRRFFSENRMIPLSQFIARQCTCPECASSPPAACASLTMTAPLLTTRSSPSSPETISVRTPSLTPTPTCIFSKSSGVSCL